MIDIKDVNKPEVAQALRDLENRGGKLTADIVLEAAKSKSSPLHGCGFEWDQTEAARKFNLEVARSLIRTVKYKIVTEDHGTIQVPVYVRDPKAEPAAQGYVALQRIIAKTPDAHAVVIAECEAAAAHLRRAVGRR